MNGPTKLLPSSAGGKFTAIFGYIVAAIGVFLSISYFMGPSGSCTASNRAELVTGSILIGIVQLLVSVGLMALVRKLNVRTSITYNTAVGFAACVLFALQLLFAIGYSFGVGTACTT